jgi:hypothetical protein
MRTEARRISPVVLVLLAALLALTMPPRVGHAQAAHVRWEIIHLSLLSSPSGSTIPLVVSSGVITSRLVAASGRADLQ